MNASTPAPAGTEPGRPILAALSSQQAPLTIALQTGTAKSTTLGVMGVIALDTVGFAVFFASRSHLLAWGFTALNAAMLVWIWFDYRAAPRPTMTVNSDGIAIRFGRHIKLDVPHTLVESAEAATWRSTPDGASDYMNFAGPLDPNILIVLRKPIAVRLPMGMTKRVTRIGIRVGDVEDVLRTLVRSSEPSFRAQ